MTEKDISEPKTGHVLQLLSDPYRRELLIGLLQAPYDDRAATARVDNLVADGGQDSSQRIPSYHNHLPRLEAAGAIDWDRDTHRVTTGSTFESFRPFLEFLADRREEHGE